MATMVRVFNSTAMRATLVQDLANFTAQYSDVVHGFAFDYEVHYDTVPPDPHFCSRPDCFWHIKNGRTKSTYWYSPRICSRTLMGYPDPISVLSGAVACDLLVMLTCALH